MPDIPERLPAPLSERTGGYDALYNPQGREYDVAIGGVPFRLATLSDMPQAVETIPVRKEQFDTEVDPGEQSLSGYWRRSQASFHHGAGYVYEPDRTENGFYGFSDSSGIDVSNPGRIRLLREMQAMGVAGDALLTKVRRTADYTVGIGTNGAVYWTNTVAGDLTALWTPPASASCTDFFIAGGWFYGATDDGRLYYGTTVDPGAATYWAFENNNPVTQMMWAKYRLWAIGGPQIFQPDVSIPTDAGAVPFEAIFTNPQDSWNYTCMAEGPASVYFGGSDGTQSSIQSITLDSSGGLPTLTGATTAAVLPKGELISHLEVVAGQYIGIGTNKGFRVGLIDASGNITYGPLLLSRNLDTNSVGDYYGCTALAVDSDSFIVAIHDATQTAIAYKVSTTEELAPLVFPYHRMVEHTGSEVGDYYKSLDVQYEAANPSQMLAVADNGLAWRQSVSDYVDTGWLESSRIRFRTTELKSFKFLDVTMPSLPAGCGVAVDLILDTDSVMPVTNITNIDQSRERFRISVVPQRFVAVRMTLSRTTATDTPTVDAFLLRAMPAIAPQRLITLPLLCYDKEQARSGHRYGYEGFARDRLRELMAFEDVAATVNYQSFAAVDSIGTQVVIESIRFSQTAPPSPHRHEGAGGILLLQLRTVNP